MQRPRIDTYFAEKGINVCYNTLGHTEELVNAYVSKFNSLVQSDQSKRSQNVKQSCYESMWDIQPRTKRTGFEDLVSQDKEFRFRVSKHIRDVFYGPTLHVPRDIQSSHDYRELLVDSLKSIHDPVLYLSGGVDSEVVALALLEADAKFVPVVFKWTDRSGKIINQYELDFAEAFCIKHGLTPDIRVVDVESLWESEEFYQFALDIQIQSAHQATHAWMVKTTAEKYPDATHLFGGEVRFFSSIEQDKPVNIVFLDKVDPPAYSGMQFFASTSAGGTSSCTLRYNNATGEYTITSLNTGPFSSGTWTTTPGSSYEYQITSVNPITGSGSFIITPSSGPTAWNPINTSSTEICRVETTAPYSDVSADFFIDVRVVGEVSPVVSSVITLGAQGVV